jgi:hypothetical protein
MTQNDQYDAAHFAFLELVRTFNEFVGPVAAKVAMMHIGTLAAEETEPCEFATVEEFIESVSENANPISQFEGAARYYGDGVFGLSICPFSKSIKTYKQIKGSLPLEYQEITDSLNEPSLRSQRLKIGSGAAVSPFCGVHQPIRSALGERIRIGGHSLKIYQLGCKSEAGYKGFADVWIQENNIDRSLVDQILDENMCCYCFRLSD